MENPSLFYFVYRFTSGIRKILIFKNQIIYISGDCGKTVTQKISIFKNINLAHKKISFLKTNFLISTDNLKQERFAEKLYF